MNITAYDLGYEANEPISNKQLEQVEDSSLSL